MLPTINPSTTKLDESFANSNIILINDHMPPPLDILLEYSSNKQLSKNTIIDLFNQASIDINSKTLVSDSYMCFDDLPNTVFTNEWLINEATLFLHNFPNWSLPAHTPTKKLAAMMNKVRPNRLILSMLLANLFSINEVAYTVDSYSNAKTVLDEMLNLTNYKFDISKCLPERWLGDNKRVCSDFLVNYPSNHSTFKNILYPNLFNQSVVSLITEPTFYERGCHISEKTIMAIYSGHLMIWVGGWCSADMAAKLGLDIFDDVIDHSYQYIEHPTMRCVEAVLRNLNLLNNLDYQIELRQRFSNRLANNLSLMRDIAKLEQMTRDNLNDPFNYDYIKSIMR